MSVLNLKVWARKKINIKKINIKKINIKKINIKKINIKKINIKKIKIKKKLFANTNYFLRDKRCF